MRRGPDTTSPQRASQVLYKALAVLLRKIYPLIPPTTLPETHRSSLSLNNMLFFTVAFSALASIAVAAPHSGNAPHGHGSLPVPGLPIRDTAPAPTNQCNTGPVQCCNTVEDKNSMSDNTSKLISLIGINVGDITGKVGTNCSPISTLAVGGNKWLVY